MSTQAVSAVVFFLDLGGVKSKKTNRMDGSTEIVSFLWARRIVHKLVGALELFLFFHILNVIIPTDELHHFSEG
jgi:hypothetical protein